MQMLLHELAHQQFNAAVLMFHQHHECTHAGHSASLWSNQPIWWCQLIVLERFKSSAIHLVLMIDV